MTFLYFWGIPLSVSLCMIFFLIGLSFIVKKKSLAARNFLEALSEAKFLRIILLCSFVPALNGLECIIWFFGFFMIMRDIILYEG